MLGLGLGETLRGRFDAAGPAAGPAPTVPVTLGEGADARLLPAAETLAELAGEERVLLVAAGDGTHAAPAARRAGHLVATEPDATLRERGSALLPEVEWHGARPRSLPFESESFDAVLAFFGATYERDHRSVAAELKRVARPGAIVGMTAWSGDMARRVNAKQPLGGARPGAWSRYETAYLHFFDFIDLDVVEHQVDGVGSFCLTRGRRP